MTTVVPAGVTFRLLRVAGTAGDVVPEFPPPPHAARKRQEITRNQTAYLDLKHEG
jgi:hypothetical protein